VFLPLEVNHLAQHTTVINSMVLIGNVVVVAYMLLRLWRNRAANPAAFHRHSCLHWVHQMHA
jgi:uncharacterized membrane protein (DUF2068 family)